MPATAAERRLATRAPASKSKIADAARQYQMDFGQRVILFLDILRERANNMLAYEQAGMPPVLNFEHDTILDARTFERPVNYALLRITGSGKDHIEDCVDEDARPVFILDLRAGHGPGIGGFKHDSEVGMAMHEGHPVYFAIFFPEPCPGQTLADVHHTLHSLPMNQVVPRAVFHLRTPTNRSSGTGAASRPFLPAKARQMAI